MGGDDKRIAAALTTARYLVPGRNRPRSVESGVSDRRSRPLWYRDANWRWNPETVGGVDDVRSPGGV